MLTPPTPDLYTPSFGFGASSGPPELALIFGVSSILPNTIPTTNLLGVLQTAGPGKRTELAGKETNRFSSLSSSKTSRL
jgi:hypothetical protein